MCLKCKNKLSNTYPSILHCPSDQPEKKWFELIDQTKKCKPKVNLPDNVTLITFNNKEKKMVLEETLDLQKVKYTVLGKGIKNWRNPFKIDLLKEYLPHVTTEFILVLDAIDVIIVRSLDNILDKFNRFGCEVLYNASSFIYPNETVYSGQEARILNAFFNHLNSGCFIGRTSYCYQLYDECSRYEDAVTKEHHYSDQIKIKVMYVRDYPKIKIDHNCEIFQLMHATKPLNAFIEVSQISEIALL